MIAYKFLNTGRVAPFSRREWPVGVWLDAERSLVTCRVGIHACRIPDLPYWLGDELWEIELDGTIAPSALKLVAQRGRLVRAVVAWDDAARGEFAEACVRRAAKHAADELREAGLEDEADELEGARALDAIARAATTTANAARERNARVAERLCGYTADAVGWAAEYPPSGVAYVAAHTAAARSSLRGDPFADERAEQARWLAERLELRGDDA